MALSLNQEKTHVPYFFLKSANIGFVQKPRAPEQWPQGRPQATALQGREGGRC